jgi:hypothetical protein
MDGTRRAYRDHVTWSPRSPTNRRRAAHSATEGGRIRLVRGGRRSATRLGVGMADSGFRQGPDAYRIGKLKQFCGCGSKEPAHTVGRKRLAFVSIPLGLPRMGPQRGVHGAWWSPRRRPCSPAGLGFFSSRCHHCQVPRDASKRLVGLRFEVVALDGLVIDDNSPLASTCTCIPEGSS